MKMTGKKTVTAEINTRGRYFTTLPLTMVAVAQQTIKPDKIIIFDDNYNDRFDMRKSEVFLYIFKMYDSLGIEWEVVFGSGIGPVANHQKMLDMVKTDYVWRVDDDEIPEFYVLEKLMKTIVSDDNIGAVGCKVYIPDGIMPYEEVHNKIIGYEVKPPIEWMDFDKISDDNEHLYSTFVYSVDAAKKSGGYVTGLPIVSHYEETLFTNRMYRHGYKLVVIPDAVVWHYRTEGGIRLFNDKRLYEICEVTFKRYIDLWNKFDLKNSDVAILEGGIGDNYSFRIVLDGMLKRGKVIVFTHYKDVYMDIDDPNLLVSDIDTAKAVGFDFDRYNIYKFMLDNKWKDNIVDAYKKMYDYENNN